MAIEPGRGETAVPLRSAFLGVVLAVVGVGAAVVFASSLGRLASTPRMYGWTWDFQIEDSQTSACNANDHGIAPDHAVAALAAACLQNVEVNGRPITGWGFVPIRGTIGAGTVSGHEPSAPDEVALGSVTLHALHKHVGDVVRVSGSNGPRPYRIVGTVVLPRLGDPQPLADGAAFTQRGLAALTKNPQDGNFSRYLLGDYAAGADRAAFARRVGTTSRRSHQAFQLGRVIGPAVPVEVDRVRQISWFPAVLASLLAGLGLAAVGHALITGVRRRRRDLAVLKTLGFDRRQVRTTVAWQATTLAAVGLLVGLPLGIVVGNLAWRVVADGLGVSTATVTPALVLLALPVVIVALNLVAFFPANAAARARPAIALQVE
jgi:predicted lysophospholipase L1 biosynthesis ABC-type transport system permease subunit